MKSSTETIIDCTNPQANKTIKDNDDKMIECQNDTKTIECNQASKRIARIQLGTNPKTFVNEISTIARVIRDKMKINLTDFLPCKVDRTITCFLENSEELEALIKYYFKTDNTECTLKQLTNNLELDSRKIKIWKPDTGFTDKTFVKKLLGHFGVVEEFYRGNKPNARKTVFLVVFANVENKLKMLRMKRVFIGKQLFKIDNYLAEPKGNLCAIGPKLRFRVSNFAGNVDEFSVKNLMDNMRSVYWQKPTGMRG